jgi:hypothetical protein
MAKAFQLAATAAALAIKSACASTQQMLADQHGTAAG